jgi:hypothetical protein
MQFDSWFPHETGPVGIVLRYRNEGVRDAQPGDRGIKGRNPPQPQMPCLPHHFLPTFWGQLPGEGAAAQRRISFSCSGSRTQTPTSSSPFIAVHVVVKRSKPKTEAVDLASSFRSEKDHPFRNPTG